MRRRAATSRTSHTEGSAVESPCDKADFIAVKVAVPRCPSRAPSRERSRYLSPCTP
jgi:hypothetical protein